jgi:adenylate kinase family enzyme
MQFVFQAMKKSESTKFLIDGFPRNQDNLDGWNRQMASNVNLLFVLFFDCLQEVRFVRHIFPKITCYRGLSMAFINSYKLIFV